MESHGWIAEQRVDIPVFAAVSMQFDEDPIRPAGNMHSGIQPQLHPFPSWCEARVNVRVFDARQQTELASRPVEFQRALNQQQMFGRRRGSDTSPNAGVVRLAKTGDVGRVVDAVDRPRLRIAWCRRRCEVRVTTGLSEHRQFLIDSAPATVGTAVAQRPITVNETVSDLAADRIAPQQTVPVKERVAKLCEFVSQAVGRVVVVMQMNVDITPAVGTQLGEPIEVLRVIFILREEKRMLRHSTAAVVKASEETRIFGTPAIDSSNRRCVISSVTARLVVIADRDEDIERFGRTIFAAVCG